MSAAAFDRRWVEETAMRLAAVPPWAVIDLFLKLESGPDSAWERANAVGPWTFDDLDDRNEFFEAAEWISRFKADGAAGHAYDWGAYALYELADGRQARAGRGDHVEPWLDALVSMKHARALLAPLGWPEQPAPRELRHALVGAMSSAAAWRPFPRVPPPPPWTRSHGGLLRYVQAWGDADAVLRSAAEASRTR